MSEASALFDAHLRRRIFLERLSTTRSRELKGYLATVRDDLVSKIARMRAAGRSSFTIRQQERLLESAESIINEVYKDIRGELRAGFEDVAKGQAAFEAQTIGAAANFQQISAVQAVAAMRAKPMEGQVLKDWLRDLTPSHRNKVQRQLRIAFTEGESLSATMARLRTITQRNGKGLETLIRTANTHIAAAVSEESWKANGDIVERYRWDSVLDSRTSPICQSRDGNIYKVGDGPVPPAHPGCRSIVVPILADFEEPEKVTYQEWLTRQSAKVQDEILGPARGKLFRGGGFTVDKFVDRKGRRIPIKELAPAPAPAPTALDTFEPGSMRRAALASDDAIRAWGAENIRRDLEERSSGNILRYDIGDNFRLMSQQIDGFWKTDFVWRNQTRSGAQATTASVAEGTQAMSQAVAAIRYMLLTESERTIAFSGATDAHQRLYSSLLRRIKAEGYEARRDGRVFLIRPVLRFGRRG